MGFLGEFWSWSTKLYYKKPYPLTLFLAKVLAYNNLFSESSRLLAMPPTRQYGQEQKENTSTHSHDPRSLPQDRTSLVVLVENRQFAAVVVLRHFSPLTAPICL